MKLGLHLPINSVSFGQVSTLLLRTIFEREKGGDNSIDWYITPISNVDLSSQAEDKEFNVWLNNKIVKTLETYNRDIPVFKLWHLNGSLESISRKQILFTFYELDKPTKVEVNIARNNTLCLSSKYSCEVFGNCGIPSNLIPVAFDDFNFKKLDKKFHQDERIVFNLCGKFEKRKHHAKAIRAWIKKFGNNGKYVLQCATYNPFFNEQQNSQMIAQSIGGNKPFNVTFYPMMKENQIYNEFLNSANVIIGMSGGEGWGLPEFQSVGIGKHAVLLNAHSYKTWGNESNAVLVNPSGKIDVYDGAFFRQGEAFNQGSIFDWNDDEFIAGCEKAAERVKSNPVNEAGLKLQQEFNKQQFLDNVITVLKAHV
jgi:hypothetical protein